MIKRSLWKLPVLIVILNEYNRQINTNIWSLISLTMWFKSSCWRIKLFKLFNQQSTRKLVYRKHYRPKGAHTLTLSTIQDSEIHNIQFKPFPKLPILLWFCENTIIKTCCTILSVWTNFYEIESFNYLK